MEKKLMKRWIKALTSGKFKQAQGALCTTKDGEPESKVVGYCCLGVLAKIQGHKKIDLVGGEFLAMDGQCGLATQDGEARDGDGEPVISFKKKVKGTPKSKTKFAPKFFATLAEANDDGIGFKQIARWIEKNYEIL